MIKIQSEAKGIESLAEQVQFLCGCVSLYMQECAMCEDAILVEADWTPIFCRALNRIELTLISLQEELHWSLLDAHTDRFGQLREEFVAGVAYALRHEPFLRDILAIEELLLRGERGFQTEEAGEQDYLSTLFRHIYDPYHDANLSRQETIYDQDSEDLIAEHPDDNERKTFIVTLRRNALFDDFFGRIYHDERREISVLVSAIILHKEQTYERIHAFFDKFMAWEVAKHRQSMRSTPEFVNLIFKENVDVDKVMHKLGELIADHTLSAQRHLYLVYRVLSQKLWLVKDKQSLFRQQMNLAFSSVLKCTQSDFQKIESYYKDREYSSWNASDRCAPSSCKDYLAIVNCLDREFQEARYALPGRLINTPGIHLPHPPK